jgi:bifunctional non-homologous end joining protein LigD
MRNVKRMPTRKQLEAYRQKRDFSVTPEPAPGTNPKRAGEGPPSFMVHKHDATRLHYDLRLELDGALASWAIPKGPSYDPSEKRLAVQTEDHPLEYGHFEGRIPDGEYGAGDSVIWDRGTYDTVPPGQAHAQREKGHLHVRLEGEKLKGEWHLVRTRPLRGKAQWLLFKAHDGKERTDFDVVAERPESVVSGRRITRGPLRRKAVDAPHPTADALLKKVWPPMKATLASTDTLKDERYLYEVKYDGFRGLAAISNGRLSFATRNALDLSGRFPDVARALSRLHVAEAVVDGEVVALDEKGVSRFERIGDPEAERRFAAFDLLWLDGEDLRQRPVEERRELLESVLANVPPPLMLAERVEGPAEAALEVAKRHGWEGLIAKRRGSTYAGLRSREWLKLKLHAAQELAILGFTPIKNGQKEIGALLVGVHEKDGFRFAGKVGTGFSSKVRGELYRELAKDVSDRPTAFDAPRMRDARWVTPKKVAQVAFTEWTADGKLRAPSFLGLRDDKRPEDVVRERPGVPSPVGSPSGSRRAPTQKAARQARE